MEVTDSSWGDTLDRRSAWYSATRAEFVAARAEDVVSELASSATRQGWYIEPAQHEEWSSSVGLLQEDLSPKVAERVEILREALGGGHLTDFHDVVLEYDLRRRGLRIDALLFAPGLIVVLEFKRSDVTASDRAQVENYAVNLLEFHAVTQRVCREGAIVVPLVVLTSEKAHHTARFKPHFHSEPWGALLARPAECDRRSLRRILNDALALRRSGCVIDRRAWVTSEFSPSSSIVDAAISLYGAHTVCAIDRHAASVDKIEACIEEVVAHVEAAKAASRNRIVVVSGAPGSGKTLVGLRLAFHPQLRNDAVFLTGNAPLVEVLTEALRDSYRRVHRSRVKLAGYPAEQARLVIENADFKIVKAHRFLGERGTHTGAADGRVVVFDEAQRTYKEGKEVLRRPLPKAEAVLILEAMEASYPGGAVVVALVGQNQAISRDETGPLAWFRAAASRGWEFAVADETLALPELASEPEWARHDLRLPLRAGHLSESMRFYRNQAVEEWADAFLGNDLESAKTIADGLRENGIEFFVTRKLSVARSWARAVRVGDDRSGIVACSQGRRLAAEGLFVELKPSIAPWMLAPAGDVRSSDALETVQNQYQIQGLELDYVIVAWDLDLRRLRGEWRAYKLSGSEWKNDKYLDVARNSYRVLLTRARKGMMFFVPEGDPDGDDETRPAVRYQEIVSALVASGVRQVDAWPIDDEVVT